MRYSTTIALGTLVLAVAGIAPVRAQCPLSFAPPLNYAPAGLTPNYFAVGDFDGDGRRDLAVTSQSNNRIYILLGNGDGTFQSAVSYVVATGSMYGIAVGSFNGDDTSDLAVANWENASVSVLRGNGNGTFQAAVTYPVGTLPWAVAVGDFNGDGQHDLAVSRVIHDANGTVSILLGNGNGTFQGAVAYPAGFFPISIRIADFDGNGTSDLAVGNDRGSSVSILLGNGDGTFAAAVEYPAGNRVPSIAVGDFDRDGVPDVACGNNAYPTPGSTTVSILLGNGDGTLRTPVSYVAGNSRLYSVEVGDFNDDDKTDLVMANFGVSVNILRGNGDGTFQPPVSFPGGSFPSQVAVADFGSDGKPDLAVGNFEPNTVSILLNTSVGKADLNCDCIVNNFDIDPFVLALTDPAGYAAAFPNCDANNADTNGDGLLNNFDIDPFVALLTGG